MQDDQIPENYADDTEDKETETVSTEELALYVSVACYMIGKGDASVEPPKTLFDTALRVVTAKDEDHAQQIIDAA